MFLKESSHSGKAEENVPELSGKVAMVHVKEDGSVSVKEETQ